MSRRFLLQVKDPAHVWKVLATRRWILLIVGGSWSCLGSVGYQSEDPAHVYVVLVTSWRILLMSTKCLLPEGRSCSCLGCLSHSDR
jgi:hypothetical protein